MCLLDAALRWDDTGLACSSDSHRDPANPLRAHGRLGAASALEYAGQAVALHASLARSDASNSAGGAIAAVRELTLSVARLDDLPDSLSIVVRRLAGDSHTLLYDFDVTCGASAIARGRMTIVVAT